MNLDDPTAKDMAELLSIFEDEMDPRDVAVLRAATKFENEDAVRHYILEHLDDLTPEWRANIIQVFQSEIEETEFQEQFKQRKMELIDQVIEDVKWFRATIGDEELKGATPSLLCGFLNQYRGRRHSVLQVKAALDAMHIWYRGE